MPSKDKNKKIEKSKSIFKETIITLIYAIVAATIIRLYVFETMLVPTPSMVPTINVGDRLFVEKVTYSAREPQIGEIVVFYTPFPDERAQQMLRAFDKFMDSFSPKEFKGSVKYVKRLVAKEGDVITLKQVDGKWKLFVNGEIPEHLKNVNYEPDGIFKYPKLWDYLAQASKLKNNKEQYRAYLFTLAQKEGNELANIVFSILGGLDPVPYGINYDVFVTKYLEPNGIKLSDYVWEENGQVYVKIPKGFYFFMGDNSPQSLDGRYFGFVPKHAVIGRPILRIWPFNAFGPVQPLVK
ncbi:MULTISPECIES: signal peptidase I [Fervidobacterium]|mgnify:CR=1 FL=1|uniref:Signal peptidase I n=1 Tax=Fervidobacterium nodosum (strain ATCC 35602 / DSM 5306 / Rt17-B1) TaxID=381764 RepID=A7HKS4_FERNB|nr:MULTISPECIES: signal peptidase I [Fervidobacterium]ABS60507.1 signal peptidase I [Fervidobacterium nodosum Rt17-B1]KAF2962528.1 S26 family signal peptidase [Fervidobacterium sp. 2310opik-2]HOJ94613.1 signal peptidase I [Fervidobacterium nodosum]